MLLFSSRISGTASSAAAEGVGARKSDTKSEIVKKFIDFCNEEKQQEKATNLGFNALKDYSYSGYNFKGNE